MFINNIIIKCVFFLFLDEFTIEPRIKESILEEINADSFTPKQFTSSAQNKDKKINKNILIDITAENIQMPPILNPPSIQDSIFHSSVSFIMTKITLIIIYYSFIILQIIFN